MVYRICRVSDDGKRYNGKWLSKKPCSKAFSNTKVFMLSEVDFELDDGYEDDEKTLIESGYSNEKESYSEAWYISMDDIHEIDYLVNEVGSIIVYSDRIRIYDGYVE